MLTTKIENRARWEHGFSLDDRKIYRLAELGMVDESWHNDICPRYEMSITGADIGDGIDLRLWADHDEPAEREMGGCQFAMSLFDCDTYEETPLIETDDFAIVELFIMGFRAFPKDGLEWGSEEQIDAQNAFFIEFEKLVKSGDGDWDEFEDWCMKATVEEMISEALKRTYQSYDNGAGKGDSYRTYFGPFDNEE